MKFQLLLLFALVAFAIAGGKKNMDKEIGYQSLGYEDWVNYGGSGNPLNSVNPMNNARLKRDVKNSEKKEKIDKEIGYFAPNYEITGAPWRMSTNQMTNARPKRDVKNGEKKEKIDKEIGYFAPNYEITGAPWRMSPNQMANARLKRDVKNGEKKEKIDKEIENLAPKDEITGPWRMSTNQMANARLKRDVKNGEKKEKIEIEDGHEGKLFDPTGYLTRKSTNAMNNARPKRDMIEWHARYGSAYPYPAAVRVQYPVPYAAPWSYYSAGAPISYPVRAAYNPEVFYNSFGYYPA